MFKFTLKTTFACDHSQRQQPDLTCRNGWATDPGMDRPALSSTSFTSFTRAELPQVKITFTMSTRRHMHAVPYKVVGGRACQRLLQPVT